MRFVDCAIPANNKGKNAIGLMYWLLAREVLYLRGNVNCNRQKPWDTMVDLFIYRDPEEVKEDDAAETTEFAPAATEGEFTAEDDGVYGGGATDWAETPTPAPAGAAPGWDSTVMNGVTDWSAQ